MRLGAQLYTVREFTQTHQEFSEALSKIAEMGYTTVQITGTDLYEPEWLAQELKKNGLICPVTHTNPTRICDDTGLLAEEHKIFGAKILGIGSAPGIFSFDTYDYELFRERFMPAALSLRDRGMLFGYHNHQLEFNKTNGITLLERIAEDFPQDALTFILDTYWIQFAGANPAEWIRRLAGRVHCIHFKDMKMDGAAQIMAPCGDGNINFADVLKACEDAGTQYIFVEQDDCYGENPFVCLKRSYDYLHSLGLG